MAAFEEIFGNTLVGKTGTVDTKNKLADCDAVALYFSAYWCGPCRGFTPQFADAYKMMTKAGKKFEVVFVSSDRDQKSFDGYYEEMPWLALPYDQREIKEKLSKKYKVRGIPSVVILDKEGKTITTNGRSKISEDPEGKEFPWTPKPLSELIGDKFAKKGKETVGKEAIQGKYLALYFSAHWCPPCRSFTPKFIETYKAMKEKGIDNFEVVFVSSDRDEASFAEYYSEMPWLALPFDLRKEKEALSSHFEVSGIPSLVILDPELKVVTDDAIGMISSDSKGEKFPWLPPLVPDVENVGGFVNDTPTIMAMVEGCDEAVVKAAEEALNEVAKNTRAASKGEDKVRFAIGKKGDALVDRVRSMANLEATPKTTPEIVLLDLSSKAVHIATGEKQNQVDVATLTSLTENFLAGKVPMVTL